MINVDQYCKTKCKISSKVKYQASHCSFLQANYFLLKVEFFPVNMDNNLTCNPHVFTFHYSNKTVIFLKSFKSLPSTQSCQELYNYIYMYVLIDVALDTLPQFAHMV